jgi:hypothetical protein
VVSSVPSNACMILSQEYFTVQEIAGILKVSTYSVIRYFANRPEVLDLGAPETRFKRRYRVLRIPREVLERFVVERTIYRHR